jgi:hypothetical protein
MLNPMATMVPIPAATYERIARQCVRAAESILCSRGALHLSNAERSACLCWRESEPSAHGTSKRNGPSSHGR